MSLTASVLIACAAFTAQAHGGGGERPLSPEEAAKLEAKHITNVRQVTYGFSRAGEGYFSPDGKSIIFQAVPGLPESVFLEPSPNQYEYQIYTAALTPGAKPKRVSTGRGACTCGYFAPDGKSILFASTHLNPSAAPKEAPAGRYKWSFPDGMDVFHADLDGKILKRLTDAHGYDAEGSFSPDGKRIVYRSDRKDNDLLQLFVNNAEGTDERQLTDDESVNWGPYWHPDGKHIVYATSRHGHSNYELYLMNVDTSAEERITFYFGFDGLPVFSPDGKRLMWTSNGRGTDRNSQLFIADFNLDPAPQTASNR
jgi:Tol biopolymer transport system component